ncbi:DUF2339 domain-containing protein [Candidatus Kaiserbacteria bacterium]|nr:MAG: DUF2339 domain-containing protein [Candidatus Kaiserbacteria bacterium]
METIIFFGIIALFMWCKSLSNRLSVLEGKDAKEVVEPHTMYAPGTFTAPANEPTPVDVSETVPVYTVPPPPTEVYTETPVPVPPPQPSVSTPNPLMEWFSENTLIKIGAFLFFLGAVWFVSYAIAQGWVSPLMRIVMGVTLGIAVCAVGVWRKYTNIEQYLVLTTLGVGIITASIFTGQFLFKLFPPVFALVLLLGTIAYAVMVSLQTRTEWLSVLSAITALLAPVLVTISDLDPILFLIYLLAVSLGFLAVVFMTHWRGVTLTLAVGTSIFLWNICLDSSALSPDIAWLFVILFSSMFYSASSVSMFRNKSVVSADVTTLGFSVVTFVTMAYALIDAEGLVTFIAAFIAAGTGYVLYVAQRPKETVSLYAGLSALLICIATAFTFDGYTLTMVYTLEITTALVLALHLRLPHYVVIVTTWLFTLPVVLSIREFDAPEWSTGIWHGPAVSIYTLTLATAVSAMYALMESKRTQNFLYQSIGGVFTTLFWVYACACTSVVWIALFDGQLVYALQYMTWSVICVLVLVFVIRRGMPASWMHLALFSFTLPVFVSFGALFDSRWATEWLHPNGVGLYFMTLLSLLIGVRFVLWGMIRQNASLRGIGGIWLGIFWIYMLTASSLFWSAVCVDQGITQVLSYISWAVVSYCFINAALHPALSSRWLALAFVTLVVPLVTTFASFGAPAWGSSAIHPDAMGLYTFTLFLVLLGLTFIRIKPGYQGDHEILDACTRIVWSGVGLYVISLVWLITHAVFASPDVAVSVALFVYTVSGLALYSAGKSMQKDIIRYVGIILLSGVVLRLLIVDVWEMDILGRIVTFLGVGLLFILTALFEKPFEKIGKDGGGK